MSNNPNTRHFEISWSSLTTEAQDSIIESVKESLKEMYKTDGEAAMKKNWHVAPKTWEEAIVRENCIDSRMWDDLEETSEEFQQYDWKYTLDEHLQEEAEKKASAGMRWLELEVEL